MCRAGHRLRAAEARLGLPARHPRGRRRRRCEDSATWTREDSPTWTREDSPHGHARIPPHGHERTHPVARGQRAGKCRRFAGCACRIRSQSRHAAPRERKGRRGMKQAARARDPPWKERLLEREGPLPSPPPSIYLSHSAFLSLSVSLSLSLSLPPSLSLSPSLSFATQQTPEVLGRHSGAHSGAPVAIMTDKTLAISTLAALRSLIGTENA